MKYRAHNGGRLLLCLLALSAVAAGWTSVRADEKKKKEKEVQDSTIESQEARSVMERFEKKAKADAWQDAFAAARELLDKHGDKLLLLDQTNTEAVGDKIRNHQLHGPTGWVLRHKLAQLPADGHDAFVKTFAEDAQRRLAAARGTADVTLLLDVGDRYFPLDEGAEALLLVGDLQLERGSLVGAAMAWRSVLELHGTAALRIKAGKRMIALLPLLGDAATALDLAQALKLARPSFEGAQAEAVAELEGAAREYADRVAEASAPDIAVDGAGSLAPVYSAAMPGVLDKRVRLPSDEVKAIDWRTQEQTTNQWGQQVVPVRRLLSGHIANEEMVLVHLGKTICAYYMDDDDSYDPPVEKGQLAYAFGGHRGIKEYLTDLVGSSCVPRFGMTIERSRVYATLKAPPLEGDKPFPRGRLVCFNVRSGEGREGKKSYWDTTQFEAQDEDQPVRRKKKKDAENANDEKKELKLSYIGTPIFGGERIYCPAANAQEPNETYVVAVAAKTGELVWKRPLATSAAFAVQNNPWEAVYPRMMPTPALSLVKGTLVVCSNNGTVQALDPIDGRVHWARTYEPDDQTNVGGRRAWRNVPDESMKQLSRGYNPPLPVGDMVLVLPVDANYHSLFRLSDGAQLTKPRGRDKSDYVLGVLGGKIVLSGNEGVTFYEVRRERKVSLEPHPGTIGTREALMGRGAIVNDTVYIPCKQKICAFRIDDSNHVRKPKVLDWKDAKKEMGDLVIGGGRFFSVGARNLHIYKEEE